MRPFKACRITLEGERNARFNYPVCSICPVQSFFRAINEAFAYFDWAACILYLYWKNQLKWAGNQIPAFSIYPDTNAPLLLLQPPVAGCRYTVA